jgi:DNA-binding transcriptional ArsR family regulator
MPLIEELKTRRYVAGDKIDKGIRDELAVKLKKSERTIRAWLEVLEERGYVSSQEGERRTKVYTLLYNPEKIEAEIAESSAIFKIADDLVLKMQKEAQNELFSKLEIGTPTDGRSESKANIDEVGDGNQALEGNNTDIKAYRSDTPSVEGCVSNQEKSPNRASFVKRSSNLRHFGEFPIVSNDSHDGSDHSHEGRGDSAQASNLDSPPSPPQTEPSQKPHAVNGLEEARRRLEEAVNQLEPEVKTFLDTYRVDDSGYSCIRCKCGSSFFSAEDFEAHIRFGSCKARRCSCGDSWLTLSELLEHVRKTNCSINPSPPPDPPEKGTKRRWRRLHKNGGYFEVSDLE